MNIVGNQVLLRAIEKSDCDLLRTIINDSETEYMLGGWSFPVSESDQEKWFDRLSSSDNVLRVVIEVEKEPIGTAILSDIDYKNGVAQIHIKLANGECRKKGYGYDTIKTIVNYAFDELRLYCIYALVSEQNAPSQKLFEKCGFKREGTLRKRLYKRGAHLNVLSYSILKDDLVY